MSVDCGINGELDNAFPLFFCVTHTNVGLLEIFAYIIFAVNKCSNQNEFSWSSYHEKFGAYVWSKKTNDVYACVHHY